MSTHKNRGQAAVEMAFGSLILVTLILFSIYFGEVTFGAMKVTEAESSALMDLTDFKAHTITRIKYQTAPNISNATGVTTLNTIRDYSDFDGRTAPFNIKAVSQTHVMTATRGMAVVCQPGGGPAYTPNPLVFAMYDDNSGAQCMAGADFFNSPRMIQQFAEKGSGGFFSGAPEFNRTTLRACGQGKTSGGACRGRSTIMLDDWGLTGPPTEWLPAPGMSGSGFATPNVSYWWTMYKGYNTSYALVGLFNATMYTLPASELAYWMAPMRHPMSNTYFPGMPWIPLVSSLMDNESKFYMSFDSSLTGFEHLLLPMMGGMPESMMGINWETTPFLISLMPYSVAFFQRMGNGGCYLGKSC